MDQPSLESQDPKLASEGSESLGSLPFLTADKADPQSEDPFVFVAGNPLEFCQWLVADAPALQWIQVEGQLDEPEVWATAARKGNDVALDVIVDDPVEQYAAIYRLVDVRNVRPVRVTIPVVPGFLKALRLAVSIHIPVRLMPGQPTRDLINELEEALEFYLHDPMVEVPVEFFHSLLAVAQVEGGPGIWIATEEDPGVFALPEASVRKEILSVQEHFQSLIDGKAECVSCRWEKVCLGYFKYPDPAYSCEGVIGLLDRIGAAGSEMKADLAAMEHGERSESNEQY